MARTDSLLILILILILILYLQSVLRIVVSKTIPSRFQ